MAIGLACNKLEKSGGGMERQARDILEGLLDRGWEVEVVARRADSALPLVRRLKRLHLVKVGWLPGKLRDAYFSWRVGGIRRKAGIAPLIACYRMTGAEIALCGGNHIGYLKAMGKTPGLADRLHVAMEKRQYGEARRIVACSDLMRRELTAFYGVAEERIRVLYPSVDGGRFFPLAAGEREALRARLGLARDRNYFLFPSGAHERKGLPFLRAYFEKSTLPIELLVCGRGAADGPNVRCVGYLKEIERYYQAVDATIMASRYEPFGMVGVESAACGTPAVMSRNMGCCEAIREPALFGFEPGDAAGLDAAVRGVLAFDRYAHGDLRACIAYDTGAERYMDEFVKVIEATEVF